MPARPERAAKSHKADGSPKKRWTSAERRDRGHGPRTRGGQTAGPEDPRSENPRTENTRTENTRTGGWGAEGARTAPVRSWQRDDRVSRSFDRRDDRPQGERSWSRDDRPARSFDRRDDRSSDRPARSFDRRDDRPQGERSWSRDDRPARSFDRRDDRSFDRRDDRSSDRPARPFAREERPARSFDRDDRDRRFGGERRSSWQRPAAEAELDETAEVETGLEVSDAVDAEPTPAVPEGTTFASLGLSEALVAPLAAEGIVTPFPIQAATIPDALTGRDVLGRGQTGSGKTLSFGLPMLTRLAGGHRHAPRGLVLVPTRELAMQVTDVLTPLAKALGLTTVLVAGGMSYTPQLRAFERGVDVVVATPGRLIDLMDSNAVDLTTVEVVVLDEADHMADLGFMPAVTTILDTVPAGGQRLLFSATLDRAVDRLVKQYLTDPVTHQVSSGKASVSTMEHHVLQVAPHDKAALTAEIASRPGRTVVFVRTQMGADRVAEQLREAGVMAGALHGGLTQGARTRILSVFKDGSMPVLVATDVAARGIHVDEVGLVLQVDPPAGPKEYLHRAGRTARAGGTGVVVTLALPHQRREMLRLTSQAGVKPVALPAQPGSAELAAATGAQQPSGGAISTADYEELIAPKRPARRPGGSRAPRGRAGGGAWGRGGDRPRGRRGDR